MKLEDVHHSGVPQQRLSHIGADVCVELELGSSPWHHPITFSFEHSSGTSRDDEIRDIYSNSRNVLPDMIDAEHTSSASLTNRGCEIPWCETESNLENLQIFSSHCYCCHVFEVNALLHKIQDRSESKHSLDECNNLLEHCNDRPMRWFLIPVKARFKSARIIGRAKRCMGTLGNIINKGLFDQKVKTILLNRASIVWNMIFVHTVVCILRLAGLIRTGPPLSVTVQCENARCLSWFGHRRLWKTWHPDGCSSSACPIWYVHSISIDVLRLTTINVELFDYLFFFERKQFS